MAALRTFVLPPILVLTTLLAFSKPAGAYSVLTHEEIVDLTWADSIQPLLLRRFPNLTPLQLQEAHAYAYGGCVIQDLGYYPFGKPVFSALLHYVRTGMVYGNLMVNVKATNDKLIDRAHRIIMAATGCDRFTATRLLIEAQSVKTAIAMQKLRISRQAAEQRIADAGGSLSKALKTNR